MKSIKGARTWRSVLATQTFSWPLTPPPPPPPPPGFSIGRSLSEGLGRMAACKRPLLGEYRLWPEPSRIRNSCVAGAPRLHTSMDTKTNHYHSLTSAPSPAHLGPLSTRATRLDRRTRAGRTTCLRALSRAMSRACQGLVKDLSRARQDPPKIPPRRPQDHPKIPPKIPPRFLQDPPLVVREGGRKGGREGGWVGVGGGVGARHGTQRAMCLPRDRARGCWLDFALYRGHWLPLLEWQNSIPCCLLRCCCVSIPQPLRTSMCTATPRALCTHTMRFLLGRDALEGKGPQRRPQKRLGAVTVGYKCH